MASLDTTIAQLQQTYCRAVHEQNLQTFMRLYDPKVRVFDAWGTWQYQGADAWQRAVEGWFTSLGSDKVQVTFTETQSFGSPECAVMSAIVSYASGGAQAAVPRVMHNRITWGLRVSGHVLRIQHEHTSAPVGFEDMKAILQR